ncbi:MAG: cytochrome b N-terminal domain-containing protein, partial [Candidatus Hydrogenedentes bacterium]|nr:cytochrome b N-terminal domain-containing protein [Candidatus Hydrogenedentota bacterium]
MIRVIKDWLEDRAGAGKALRAFMDEPVPKSTGWRNTLGSVAGALILGQIVTGVLLMLFYVPHPDAAYESLEYVAGSLRAGGLILALHYWGASFIVVAIFAHMARVFFSGAYKKPRELTWLVGVSLFGVIMGFAFTGQLLPWNQAGYWAAKVGIEIASSAPIVGDLIKQLLTGGETLGALTLTRFYTIHVILLPLALGVLVPLHLYLLRRHGPMRPAHDASTDTAPFYPGQLARDLVMISIVFLGLIAVAAIFIGPRSGPIDLTDTSYIPRPEWFFLSHFEILRITPGSLKIVATFVLPNILLVLLLALPWLDRANTTALKDRRLILSAGTVVIAAI